MATLRRCALAAVLLGSIGCGGGAEDGELVDVHGGTTTDSMSLGEATLDQNGDRTAMRRWHADFDIREQLGDRDTLLLGFGAAESQGEVAASFSVTVLLDKQLERGPLSLAGSYDLGFGEGTSALLVIERDGRRLSSRDAELDEGDRSGVLTIESHEAGRIRGRLTAELEDETEVEIGFEGELEGSCWVLSDGEDSEVVASPPVDGMSWAQGTFEHPFCAQYFQ